MSSKWWGYNIDQMLHFNEDEHFQDGIHSLSLRLNHTQQMTQHEAFSAASPELVYNANLTAHSPNRLSHKSSTHNLLIALHI
jgi:hypothetical protein